MRCVVSFSLLFVVHKMVRILSSEVCLQALKLLPTLALGLCGSLSDSSPGFGSLSTAII